MDSHDKPGIPVPRLVTIAALAAVVAVGAWVWKEWQRDALERALFDPDAPGVKRVQSVEFWAAQGERAVPELVGGLTDESAEVREYALVSLRRMGTKGKAAVPDVLARLDDPNENVRAAAAVALIAIDPAPQERAPQLAQALSREQNAQVRVTIADALVQIGPPAVPAVLSVADTSRPELRLDLIRPLVRIGGDDPRALDVLRAYSMDPRSDVRKAAFSAMWSAMTFEDALRGLSDADAGVVVIALDRLAAIARDGGALSDDQLSHAVPAIAAYLPREQSASLDVSAGYNKRSQEDAAINALAALGPRARSAAADLERVLRDEAGRPRINVVRALISIGAEANVVVTALRDEILDAGENGDYRAAQLLWDYRPDAAGALVPELIAQLDSGDPDTQVGAAAAIYAIAPAARDRVAELVTVLRRPESRVQWPLVAALECIGPEARESVGVLIQRIERRLEGETPSRQASSELDALGGIGVADKEVLAVLRRAANDEYAQNRCSAIRNMGRISFPPEQILDALTRAMNDPEPNVRAAAAVAFGMLRSDRDAAVAALRTMLIDGSPYVCKAAVKSLGQLGSDARVSLPELKGMTQAASRENVPGAGLIPSNDRPPDWYPDFLSETYTTPLQELLTEAIARIDSGPSPSP